MVEQLYKDDDCAPKSERKEFGAGMVKIDLDTCSGCKMCVTICVAGLFDFVDKKPVIPEVHNDCIGCGCCEAICETGSMTIDYPYDFGGKWKTLDRGELSLPRQF